MENSFQSLLQKLQQEKAQVHVHLEKQQRDMEKLQRDMEMARFNTLGFYDYLLQKVNILANSGSSFSSSNLKGEIARARAFYEMPLANAVEETCSLDDIFPLTILNRVNVSVNGADKIDKVSVSVGPSASNSSNVDAATQTENGANLGNNTREELTLDGEAKETADTLNSNGTNGEFNDQNENSDNVEDDGSANCNESEQIGEIEYHENESYTDKVTNETEDNGENSDDEIMISENDNIDAEEEEEETVQDIVRGPSTSRQLIPSASKRQSSVSQKATKRQRIEGSVNTKAPGCITEKLRCHMPDCSLVTTKDAMDAHLPLKHQLERYRCLDEKCHQDKSASFAAHKDVKKHRNDFHPVLENERKRWGCPKCPFRCEEYRELINHYTRHHEMGEFACSVAKCTFKSLTTRSVIYSHHHKHVKAEYPCLFENCGKSFKNKHTLKDHGLMHSGERPLVCPTCNKTFTLKTHLKNHRRTHQTIQPFSCTWLGCNYQAAQKVTAILHIRMEHLGQKKNMKDERKLGTKENREAAKFLKIDRSLLLKF